jgi:ATP-binding cassette subfamily B protein
MQDAAPAENAGPVKSHTVRRVVGIFKPYRRKVSIVGALIVITSTLGIVNPLLQKAVFDNALFGNLRGGGCGGHACPNLHLLAFYVALMVAIPVVSGGLGIAQTYLSNVVGLRVMQDIRNALYRHLQRMPLRFFTATRTGEIQSRMANDVGGVQSVVTDTASTILSNVVIVISTLVAMLILSWQLTVLSLFLTPVFVYLTRRVGNARREVARQTQRTYADMTAITEETLSVSGILLSKAFGRQRYETDRFAGENQRLTGSLIRQQMIGRSFGAIVQIFFSSMPAFVYLVAGYVIQGGGHTFLGGALTAGTLVSFTTLQSRLFFPIGSMLQVSIEVQSSMALFDRIFEYLDMSQEIADAPDAVDVSSPQGLVRFRDVSFRYDGAPEGPAAPVSPDVDGDRVAARLWTLEGVDLEIRPGQLAALVGPSGAGKTTMTYLVPRFYDVQQGAVEIDGVDVRKIKLESLGDAIGMVTQETYLFHDTIRRNMLYGKPDATQDELEAAAHAAFIHDRIAEMSEGYDTVVGERGYRMSGGEKQRLAIARVVLKDPKILILDEATSSLDTTSERLVQEALRPLMRGRTTIAIAHRLSTILSADVIFVLDRGRLVEQGNHRELLERGGLYATLYEQQFRGGLIEAECEDGVVLASGEVVSTATKSEA